MYAGFLNGRCSPSQGSADGDDTNIDCVSSSQTYQGFANPAITVAIGRQDKPISKCSGIVIKNREIIYGGALADFARALGPGQWGHMASPINAIIDTNGGENVYIVRNTSCCLVKKSKIKLNKDGRCNECTSLHKSMRNAILSANKIVDLPKNIGIAGFTRIELKRFTKEFLVESILGLQPQVQHDTAEQVETVIIVDKSEGNQKVKKRAGDMSQAGVIEEEMCWLHEPIRAHDLNDNCMENVPILDVVDKDISERILGTLNIKDFETQYVAASAVAGQALNKKLTVPQSTLNLLVEAETTKNNEVVAEKETNDSHNANEGPSLTRNQLKRKARKRSYNNVDKKSTLFNKLRSIASELTPLVEGLESEIDLTVRNNLHLLIDLCVRSQQGLRGIIPNTPLLQGTLLLSEQCYVSCTGGRNYDNLQKSFFALGSAKLIKNRLKRFNTKSNVQCTTMEKCFELCKELKEKEFEKNHDPSSCDFLDIVSLGLDGTNIGSVSKYNTLGEGVCTADTLTETYQRFESISLDKSSVLRNANPNNAEVVMIEFTGMKEKCVFPMSVKFGRSVSSGSVAKQMFESQVACSTWGFAPLTLGADAAGPNQKASGSFYSGRLVLDKCPQWDKAPLQSANLDFAPRNIINPFRPTLYNGAPLICQYISDPQHAVKNLHAKICSGSVTLFADDDPHGLGTTTIDMKLLRECFVAHEALLLRCSNRYITLKMFDSTASSYGKMLVVEAYLFFSLEHVNVMTDISNKILFLLQNGVCLVSTEKDNLALKMYQVLIPLCTHMSKYIKAFENWGKWIGLRTTHEERTCLSDYQSSSLVDMEKAALFVLGHYRQAQELNLCTYRPITIVNIVQIMQVMVHISRIYSTIMFPGRKFGLNALGSAKNELFFGAVKSSIPPGKLGVELFKCAVRMECMKRHNKLSLKNQDEGKRSKET